VPSSKIGEYVNAELDYYLRFYNYTKHAGPPLSGGWTDWPPWIPQLLVYFDNAVDAVGAHNEREAYQGIGVKHG